MIEFVFGVDDLARTSFAYSPLQEAAFSLRAWRDPVRYPHMRPWLRRMRPVYDRLDRQVLDAMVTRRLWIPDCLTPRPSSARPTFAAELALFRATGPEVLAAGLRDAYGDEVFPAVLSGDPERLRARVADALEAYWTGCLSGEWWARVQSLFEADLAHRGRVLAEEGVEALFAGLDPRLSWDGQRAVLQLGRPGNLGGWWQRSVPVAGRGMVLCPTLFARGAQPLCTPDLPPALFYPSRGRAVLAESVAKQPLDDGHRPLVRLLGAPRARLLLLLAEPASTTELAHRLGVTAGAVSQHLRVLHEAGLLTRTRAGRSVRYRRSELGDGVCGGG
ncbi:helix-turn-helix domain-containing protein [Streptomyces sp. N2-109]|uniref:Helix-turn-helix domain-containing protein n=1 Tax=Streptomyces gossypii TaxID=2883101 RepID=A0ABT2JST1_9ACTN|nr:helix-turn-helix domain-containing protein [Streptomyces gossypii]MCT2590319.1 helix-turn-helix domain-containing protein [Streptomyces gossypii]